MSFKTNEEAEFDFAISQSDQTIDRLIKERTKQDARIAELTTVVNEQAQGLAESFIRNTELAAEVASIRGHCAALIGWLKTLDAKGFVDHHQDVEDARNALKEGV